MAEAEDLVTSELGISRESFERMLRDLVTMREGEYELAPGGTKQVVIGGRYYGLIRRR